MAVKWIQSGFKGVRFYKHDTRKNGVKFDRYFAIRYQAGGVRKEEGLGWESDGWTEQRAALKLAELKENYKRGQGPVRMQEQRRRGEERRKAEEEAKVREETENRILDDIFTDYLDWAKANNRWHANDEYRYRIHIKPVLGQKRLAEITPFDLERLKKGMADQKKAAATIKHVLAIIRRVFNLAGTWGIYAGDNPVKKIKLPKADNAKLRTLTDDEEADLFSRLKTKSQHVHDQALVALYGGLRFEETALLRWRDVNTDDALLIVHGKGGKVRTVPLCARLVDMFEERFNRQKEKSDPKPDTLIFPATTGKVQTKISKTYFNCVQEAGLNRGKDRRYKVDFHALRHTFATRLASQGTPLNVLRDLLGHADFQMVSRYSHIQPGEMMKAVQGLDKKPKKPAKVVNLDQE